MSANPSFIFAADAQPLNQVMQAGAFAMATAIQQLTEMGLTVIGLEFSTQSFPTIQIQTSAKCAELIAKNEAVYYRLHGAGADRGKSGQFHLGRVRVVWNEKGH